MLLQVKEHAMTNKKGDAANCLPFWIHTSNIKQRTKQASMECYNVTQDNIKVLSYYK